MKRAAHKSKSIIFFTLSIILTVGTSLVADENFKQLMGENMGWVTGAMAIVGLWLRMVTTKPIGYDENNPVERELNRDDSDQYGV